VWPCLAVFVSVAPVAVRAHAVEAVMDLPRAGAALYDPEQALRYTPVLRLRATGFL